MPTQARENMYHSILREVRIPDIETRQLSQELAHNNKITPRQVTLAAKQATLISGNTQTIKRNIAQKEKLRHGTRPPDMRPIEHYDPALVRADINLEALAEQMVALGTRRFSLCLCGPPGTGKTAFVRYIAEQMGIDILPRRASDLLNKYVGESEQNIASAFAEALQTSAFLVFDEVDSLLMDRQSAQRSWEVSMVNELLSQMGTTSPPICLHHKPVGHHRPGSRTPLRISRRILLPGSTAHQPRLRAVLQQQSTILRTRTDQTHPRRLCQRARTCRDTGLPERPRAHRVCPRRRMLHKTRRCLPRFLTP